MLCERCHRNAATTILTQTVNGHTTTEHLCAECAYQSGFTGLFNGFPFSQILSGMNRAARTSTKRCPKCGATLQEIVNSGHLGCADCYTTFRSELMPTIQSIHGKAAHIGKKPKSSIPKPPPARPLLAERIAQLKDDLQQAVKEENFETAAKLRDQIRELSDTDSAEK